ncbi:hypothetical protein Fleli_2374 [Bernardetia litoralis DSM 6794]|uniref:PsbP C-terminal domain-containing protein n=1 Tax=Bernardetia litoralis (strain ATCC 23117 / DSM 6794 / NBRC 15988 / NCIMB 1366 / Fx l1 / Sio-4) TaxID=880071 RepID=I4ALB1_BERLS|nr:hypothetical protein [Bernardetia litoralis]AFM04708.1 hypothetical protein Fleli_2335 [Bernardetia litoralis DSM 6794]AFM04746.1 hypothetical protein Fleli_2374 [Bernardetia litoralis DSM 6794]
MRKLKIVILVFLLAIMHTTITFGQLELEDLKIDITITNFQYATNFQGTNVYTKNGLSDINTTNPSAFSITLAENVSYEDAKSQLEQLFLISKMNGYKMTDVIQQDTLVNGNKIFQISYTETDESIKYKNYVFNAFIIKDKTLIFFVSGDLDNGIYIEKFKQTFYALKI